MIPLMKMTNVMMEVSFSVILKLFIVKLYIFTELTENNVILEVNRNLLSKVFYLIKNFLKIEISF